MDFKKQQRQKACTTRPWAYLIPIDIRIETLAQVKVECVQIYGHDFEECDKRKVCFTKTCMGRDLEWKSPTALPYLQRFAKIVGINEGDQYKITTDCQKCPIYKTCTSTCSQVNDFINRSSDPQVQFVYQENLETSNEEYTQSKGERPKEQGLELPWDILTPAKARVIRKYLYEHKDFLIVAKELDLNNQAEAKYFYYSAINKLSEWAVMRKFYNENKNSLTNQQKQVIHEVYINNKDLTELAKELNVSVAAISQTLKRVVSKYAVKWPIFVKKEKGKIVYNVPEIFK